MASRLDGKVAIVTGAGSGIGRAAAQLFSAEGACVVCADLNEEGAVQTLKGMPKIDEKTAIALKVDVTVPTQVEHMVAHTIKTFGRLDVLYANAGIGESCNAIELTLELWNRMITVNLTSVWLSAKYSLPHMIAGGGGSIINQSSSAGLMAVPAMPHYCAAKTGVIGLTRQLALDYGPQGIRVNAICPSAIPTPLMDSVWTKRARDAGSEMTIAELEAATAAKLPLRRLGVLADCAQLALFLASDESSWITGAAIPLDGGLAAT
jgi:NAD(P)-dependent dehydrogenase (short-subunit alcohol dehydrogenase family)